MIQLLDIAMVQFLQGTFNGVASAVIWSSPDAAFQRYNEQKKTQATLPFLSMWRPNMDIKDSQNRIESMDGHVMHRHASKGPPAVHELKMQPRIYVEPVYELTAWVKEMKGTFAMERPMMFFRAHKNVVVPFEGNNYSFMILPESNDKDIDYMSFYEKGQCYKITVNVRVKDAFWMLNVDAKMVLKENLGFYQEMIGGEPVLIGQSTVEWEDK